MSTERRKSKLLIKKNLKAQLALNKIKLKLGELRLKSQAQEHMIEYELQMRGIIAEFRVWGVVSLAPALPRHPHYFVSEAIPQAPQTERANAGQSRPISVTVSNVTSLFPNQPPSTRITYPADALFCPDLCPNQSANLKGILRMFALIVRDGYHA